MVHGQARSWSTSSLIESHLALTAPAPDAPAGGVQPPAPSPAPPPPRATAPGLSAADTALGFRLGPHGLRTHPLFYSGEYAPPPGWLPPPDSAPPTAGASVTGNARARISAALCIPVARDLVTDSSPFTVSSVHPCEVCKRPGHAQYECPRRFFTTYHRPLPGFLPGGDPDPAAWAHGHLLPAARAAMAAYLTALGVLPHRRFGVTIAHIAGGTAPPAPP